MDGLLWYVCIHIGLGGNLLDGNWLEIVLLIAIGGLQLLPFFLYLGLLGPCGGPKSGPWSIF